MRHVSVPKIIHHDYLHQPQSVDGKGKERVGSRSNSVRSPNNLSDTNLSPICDQYLTNQMCQKPRGLTVFFSSGDVEHNVEGWEVQDQPSHSQVSAAAQTLSSK